MIRIYQSIIDGYIIYDIILHILKERNSMTKELAEKESRVERENRADKEVKTIDQRIDRIYRMAQGHFGDVRFVGIKRHTKIGWVAKVQFDEFESLMAEGDSAIDALRQLRKRLKKIIDRYNLV